jgi:hypothetical protein
LQQVAQATQQIEAAAQACYGRVKENPAYAGVLERFPVFNIASAPLTRQIDNGFATPAEAQALIALHDDANACREAKAASLESINPREAAFFRATGHPATEIYASIIQGRATWGQAVTALRRLDAQRQLEAQARADADWQNRRALLMMEGPPPAVRTRSLSLPQPQQTNCTRYGNTVNCTTY